MRVHVLTRTCKMQNFYLLDYLVYTVTEGLQTTEITLMCRGFSWTIQLVDRPRNPLLPRSQQAHYHITIEPNPQGI